MSNRLRVNAPHALLVSSGVWITVKLIMVMVTLIMVVVTLIKVVVGAM